VLKDPTENSYSQRLTPSRLTLFTGKGGVGKTTLALSYALRLKQLGYKVVYNSFDDHTQGKISKDLGLERLDLHLEKSAEIYIAKKLGSETIASWIMKTPFFSALFHMIPGLSQMILLGHIIDLIESDPTLYLVLDSPASGHTMSMLESPKNFKDMFKEGLIVSDINRMYRFLEKTENFDSKIVMLPNEMAVQEGHELNEGLKGLGYHESAMLMNDLLSYNDEIKQLGDDLPNFLKASVETESQFLKDGVINFPHISSNKEKEIVESLTSCWGQS
jgi:hypothetical protein